jgi:hypothetical protein
MRLAALYGIHIIMKNIIKYIRNYWSDRLYTWLLKWCSKQYPNFIKTTFRSEQYVTLKERNDNHPHPIAAQYRQEANLFIEKVIATTGLTSFSVSASNTDVKNGVGGSRLVYVPKDATLDTPTRNKMEAHDAIKLIDVDYYMDMPQLITTMRPICMYTFTPTSVADQIEDSTYSFNENNEVEVQITGGARYKHKIWEYDHDTIMTHYWWGSIISAIEQRPTSSKNHKIVLIIPQIKIYGPLARLLPQTTLKYKQITFGGLNIIDTLDNIRKPITLMRSVGLPNVPVCITLPYNVLRSAIIKANESKHVSAADVERLFRLDKYKLNNPEQIATEFLAVYRKFPDIIGNNEVVPGSLTAEDFNYQPIGPSVFEEGKITMRYVGVPLSKLGFSPREGLNSDTKCIEYRIKQHTNTKKWPNVFMKYVMEFNEHMIPNSEMHKLVPTDMVDVYTNQSRPTQISIIEKARNWLFTNTDKVVSAFQKKESYPSIKAPRNISTVNGDVKIRYSCFVYAVKEIMCRQEWFAFSLTPAELEDRMAIVADKANYLVAADGTAFAEHRSEYMIKAEAMLLARAFPQDYIKEMLELHAQHYKCKGVTKYGVKYDTGTTRLSGGLETSYFNTYDMALLNYIALRSQYDSVKAWNMMGIYGGDDSLTPNLPAAALKKVGTMTGYVFKTIHYDMSDPVGFLGRTWLNPWATKDNMYQLSRFVAKQHLTNTPSNITDGEVFMRRVESYMTTDYNTPLIRQWCEMITRVFGNLTARQKKKFIGRGEEAWFAQYNMPFTQQLSSTHPLMLDVAAEELGVTAGHLMNVMTLIDSINTIEDMAKLYLIFNLEPSAPVLPAVIRGELIMSQ